MIDVEEDLFFTVPKPVVRCGNCCQLSEVIFLKLSELGSRRTNSFPQSAKSNVSYQWYKLP